MKVQHIQFDGKWIAEVRNDNYQDGQPAILYVPGIDKRDTTGTERGLINIENSIALSGKNGNNIDPKSLYNSADHFTANILTFAAKNNYEHKEIQGALKYADEKLKSGQKGGIFVSLGAFGLLEQSDVDPSLPARFDAMVVIASGPGTRANTAKNIAASKTPIWFITTEGDDYAGTHDEVTYNLHRDILAKGGVSFLTVFKAGYFADPHVIQGVIVNGWDAFFNKVGFSPNISGQTVPGMSVYQFLLSNKKGMRVVAPSEKYTPGVQPAPIPAGPKLVRTVQFFDNNTYREI
jgi:hypothetical protein